MGCVLTAARVAGNVYLGGYPTIRQLGKHKDVRTDQSTPHSTAQLRREPLHSYLDPTPKGPRDLSDRVENELCSEIGQKRKDTRKKKFVTIYGDRC